MMCKRPKTTLMNTRIYIDSRREGLAPVRIAISQDRKVAYITVEGVKIRPEWWNGTAVTGTPNAMYLNTLIAETQAKVNKALVMIGDTDGMTAIGIRDAVLRLMRPEKKEKPKYMLSAMLRAHGDKVKPNTRSLYIYTADVVESFMPDVEISRVDRKWLESLDRHMMERGMKTNSRSIIMRNIRTVYNEALCDGLVSAYPFRQFKIKDEPTEKRSLTMDELQKLLHYPCDEWQKIYVDYFFLCFFLCGINLVDLAGLRDEDMHGGRIVYKRSKTGRLYDIKVEPEALALIERYKGHDGRLVDICDRYKNYKDFAAHLTNGLRSIGTQWSNGETRKGEPLFPKITQYWCRHSWATAAYELDVPMEIIAQALGHAFGSKTTSIYIRPNQAKADEANRRVMDRLFGLR